MLYTFVSKYNDMKIYQTIIVAFTLIIMGSATANAEKKESKPEATTTLTIKGIVQDQLTREKLAGVSIQIGTSEETIYSDPDGAFMLPDFEPGTTTIKVKCISYKEKEITLDSKSIKKGKFSVSLEPILP